MASRALRLPRSISRISNWSLIVDGSCFSAKMPVSTAVSCVAQGFLSSFSVLFVRAEGPAQVAGCHWIVAAFILYTPFRILRSVCREGCWSLRLAFIVFLAPGLHPQARQGP